MLTLLFMVPNQREGTSIWFWYVIYTEVVDRQRFTKCLWSWRIEKLEAMLIQVS